MQRIIHMVNSVKYIANKGKCTKNIDRQRSDLLAQVSKIKALRSID